MLLSDLAQSDHVKLLVYGSSSTGKTCLAAGFPGPIKFWDFDNKVSSAASFYKNDQARLKEIDVTQFGPIARKDRMNKWREEFRVIAELANSGKPLPFKTLVLDSLTTFVSYLLDDYVHVSQTGLKRTFADVNVMQDYQLLDKQLTQTISGLLSLPCNVVMLGHLQVDKDEATGLMLRRPLMAGKFADKLPIYFEEVYVSKIDGKGQYVLQTQTDSMFTCRTQRGLPKEIPTKYESIINKA